MSALPASPRIAIGEKIYQKIVSLCAHYNGGEDPGIVMRGWDASLKALIDQKLSKLGICVLVCAPKRKPLQEQFSFIQKMLAWKPSNEIGDHLLQVWLLRKHQDMLITFLNTLDIPHDGNGIVNELPETLDKEKLAKAVDELFEKYPAGVASVYLQMFQLQTEDGWDELAEVLANDPRVTIR